MHSVDKEQKTNPILFYSQVYKRRTNLRTTVDKDDGGMLPAGDQVLWFVQHAVQIEARLPCEAKDLWRSGVEGKTWGEKNKKYTDVI